MRKLIGDFFLLAVSKSCFAQTDFDVLEKATRRELKEMHLKKYQQGTGRNGFAFFVDKDTRQIVSVELRGIDTTVNGIVLKNLHANFRYDSLFRFIPSWKTEDGYRNEIYYLQGYKIVATNGFRALSVDDIALLRNKAYELLERAKLTLQLQEPQ